MQNCISLKYVLLLQIRKLKVGTKLNRIEMKMEIVNLWEDAATIFNTQKFIKDKSMKSVNSQMQYVTHPCPSKKFSFFFNKDQQKRQFITFVTQQSVTSIFPLDSTHTQSIALKIFLFCFVTPGMKSLSTTILSKVIDIFHRFGIKVFLRAQNTETITTYKSTNADPHTRKKFCYCA